MKKVARNLSVISCSLLLLGGCASDSAFMSLFGQEASTDYSKSDLPTLGSTNFEPIEISKVGNTGTLVGQKVIAFRNELTELQESIKQNNAELQSVRASVINNAIEYHNTTAAMEAKLQVGTTPGNPIMYNMLQKTQGNVVIMDENANTLNNIYNQAVSDISVVNNLLDAVRATYSVSGAIDEDHAQLRTIENETSQTAILLNSLISEVGSDYSRQLEYTNTARRYLASLDRAIKVGSYGVNNAPLPPMDNRRYMPQRHDDVMSHAPRPVERKPHFRSSSAETGISGKPLFAAKFNRGNVNYQDSLKNAVRAARRKNADFRYEVVAVAPSTAAAEVKNTAQSHASDVFKQLVELGINPDKIDILSKTSDRADGAEVQIFVK